MKVLLLGLSSVATRKVLPALERLDEIDAIEVASRRGAPESTGPKHAASYGGFEQALRESDAEIAYVSTVNSEHAEWIERALDADKHVVVDKPAVLDPDEAERLWKRAEDANRVLAEATVWSAHPQVALCRDALGSAATGPVRISAWLSIPPLPDGDFRYRADQGGGALNDLGPYAVSVGRVLLGTDPDSIHCVVNSRRSDDLETAFSVLLGHPGGSSVVGQFGFDTEYVNGMTLAGPDASVAIERIFTTPADLDNTLRVRAGNASEERKAPRADAFAEFLRRVVGATRDPNERHALGLDLRTDARTLAALRRAADGGA